MPIQHKNISKFRLIPHPRRPRMNRRKHSRMTHLIQVQDKKTTKPVSSSNKPSKFQARRKSDNEETPLKQPHHDAFMSKKEILERIKRLH